MSIMQALGKIYFETEDEITVFAVVNASSDEIEYSTEWLEDQLVEYGCSGLNVLKTAHEKLAELFASNRQGRVMLGNKIDSKVDLEISEDGLVAKLYITGPEGGDLPGSKKLVEVLNSKEVSLGLVDKQKIVSLVRQSQVIGAGESANVVIANGRAPQHGIDTQFECLIENVTIRKPSQRDDGSLDYYDLGEIPCVEAGSELMKQIAPTLSRNGRSVTGKDLKARVGKKLKFHQCKGAEVSPDNPELLISKVKGQPIMTDRGVIIQNIHTVNNVDIQTGHIEYDGSLVVRGDVASGMKINVTGDVQVFGMVENACIDAGGNIDIKMGAIGRANSMESEGKMQIQCAGNLSAGQLENVHANVQGDVLIKSRISNCQVKAGCQVIVGNPRQDKSGIVGGNIIAGSVIRAEVLGSSAGTLTSVAIACSDEVLEKVEAVKTEITEYEELLGKMLGLSVDLSKKSSGDAKKLLIKVKKDTQEVRAKVNELISQKYEIEAAIEHVKTGKIIVQKEAFQGVTVKIMLKEQQIKSKYNKGVFLLINGALAFNSVMS